MEEQSPWQERPERVNLINETTEPRDLQRTTAGILIAGRRGRLGNRLWNFRRLAPSPLTLPSCYPSLLFLLSSYISSQQLIYSYYANLTLYPPT